MKNIYSAGARYERDAFRDYLRRQVKQAQREQSMILAATWDQALQWVLERKARYDKKLKGLGK